MRKSYFLPGLISVTALAFALSTGASANQSSNDYLQSMVMGTPEESVLDLMVIAPSDGLDSLPKPVIMTSLSDDLVEFDFTSGVMTFTVDGTLSCFDLREDWSDSQARLRIYDNNVSTYSTGDVFGVVGELGLSADLHYIFDPATLALDAESNAACFYDSGSGMALFGSSPQGGNLSVSVTPSLPVNWPFVGITESVQYTITVQNTGSTDINRLAVQEIHTRARANHNFPVGLRQDPYQAVGCSSTLGGDCADAVSDSITINEDPLVIVYPPFVRGEELSLPAGASLTFSINRTVELSGGADLQDAFGYSLPIHFVAVDLDNPGNHAANTETLQVVGTGQISAEASNPSPTVSADGTTSTLITVQIENSQGQPLQESGIQVTAEVDPSVAGDINFPASLLTQSDGTASFWIQSEKAATYQINFTAPALLEDGESVPATDSVTLDFQADEVAAFEFSIDFPDPLLSPSILPDYLVLAIDQFGNLDTGYEGPVNINLITPIGFTINLDGTLALGGVASFSGTALPADESGMGYFIEARRANPTIEGSSNPFDLFMVPEGDLSIELDGTAADGQSVDQASSYLLDITASNVSVDPLFELAVVVQGRGPLDAVVRPIDEWCAELFTDFNCAALLASLGPEAGFDNSSTLFEDTVTVRANAEPGTWELDFQLVMVTGPDDYLLVDSFYVDLTVNAVANGATGFVVAHRNGGTMDPVNTNTVREGELVDFGLSVLNASVADGRRLAVVFDGQGPGDSTNQPGMDICLALMEEESCLDLDSSIGFDNHFAFDIDLIEEMLVQIRQDDALGDWLLNFHLVSFDPAESPPDASIEVVSTLSLNIEVIENTADGRLKVIANNIQAGTQPLTLVQGQDFSLILEIEDLVIDVLDSIEGVAVLWTIDGPDFGEPMVGELVCWLLLQDGNCQNLADATGLENPHLLSGEVFNQNVTVQPDTTTGTWNLEFWLVAVENGSAILMELHSQEIHVISDRLFGDGFQDGLTD